MKLCEVGTRNAMLGNNNNNIFCKNLGISHSTWTSCSPRQVVRASSGLLRKQKRYPSKHQNQSTRCVQSQKTQTVQWTNQYSRENHGAEGKRVITCSDWTRKWRDIFYANRSRPPHTSHCFVGRQKLFACLLVCSEFRQVCDKIGACRAMSDSARSQNVLSGLVG